MHKTMQRLEVKYGISPEFTPVRAFWVNTKRQLSGSQDRIRAHCGIGLCARVTDAAQLGEDDDFDEDDVPEEFLDPVAYDIM